MEFSITAQNGDSVKVEAENWMLAMGKAMTFFQADISELGRMVCSPGSDGSVFVDSPGSQRSWMLRPIEPKIKVVAAEPTLPVGPEPEPEPTQEEDFSTPPPAIHMPSTSSLHKETPDLPAQAQQVEAEAPVGAEASASVEAEAPDEAHSFDDFDEVESLAERLFDLSMDLMGVGPDEACQEALDLMLEFVPVEAGSVARGTLNDPALRFVAASGPVADQILGTTVQFGQGIIGSCYDIGGTVVIRDASEEARHLHHIDDQTGFVTRSVLCVPVVGEDGQTYGVVELLNPRDGEFSAEHIETVETVARTLAGVLSSSGA